MNKKSTTEKPNTAAVLPNQDAPVLPKKSSRKNVSKPVPKPATKTDTESATKTATKAATKPATKTTTKAEVSLTTDNGKQAEALTDREYLKRELSRRELARRSYRRYLYYVHGITWKRTRMSDYLADTVQQFIEEDTGHPYDVLLIETPPQHGKSLTITESFPSWYLGRYPKNRVIEASYNDDTAKRFGRKNLEKVETYGEKLFGVKKGSIWTTTEFEFENGWGRMISRGIMSGITGNPANLMIIDDPIKNREEADSATYRAKLWGEWQNTLKSRLAAGAKVIVIMTPWHEDDLAANLLKKEPNTRLVRLPVEAEEGDLLGRKPGDALAPELGKDRVWLEQFKQGYINDPKNGGLRAWQALFQCSPRVEGGNLIRREWWKYYDPKEITSFATTVISVDATFKGNETNDFVAIQVWGKRGIDYYLRYSLNGTEQRPGLLNDVRAGDVITGFDDGNRYWVCANGHAYLWDYLLSARTDPSWFYFTSIYAAAFFRTVGKSYHLDSRGRVSVFIRNFMDYGAAIEKVYQFPPQFFDTYDRLKDVLYCIFTVRSDTDSVVRIVYESDYEKRADLTDIRSMSWKLVPRNLAYRCLGIQKFAHVARRKPGCRHVRHFSMRLENAERAQDLAIISAQIYFRYLGRDR